MYTCFQCGLQIPPFRRSTFYCSDDCAYAAKLERERNRAEFNRNKIALLENEVRLKNAFNKYGKNPFSAQVLLDSEFHWSIYSEIKEIDGIPVKILINYGYTLFDNEKIVIWKF
ncbi:MAG: hypothetical protein J0L83_13765 [Chitinophagales bacterium]|jgi:predicted nucleic acid-binding Zn ribbon protein|nr:hypothetical protein [Chitinophagales bacterium]